MVNPAAGIRNCVLWGQDCQVLLAGLMLTARLLMLPGFSLANRRLLGDCLVATAQPEPKP